jgi:hypothetical protein
MALCQQVETFIKNYASASGLAFEWDRNVLTYLVEIAGCVRCGTINPHAAPEVLFIFDYGEQPDYFLCWLQILLEQEVERGSELSCRVCIEANQVSVQFKQLVPESCAQTLLPLMFRMIERELRIVDRIFAEAERHSHEKAGPIPFAGPGMTIH